MFPSYRHQSIDLLCKSTDWCLYDGNIGRKRGKSKRFFGIKFDHKLKFDSRVESIFQKASAKLEIKTFKLPF